MTRRDKLQSAAFILCLLTAVVIEASILVAGVMVVAVGVLTVLSYLPERRRRKSVHIIPRDLRRDLRR